MSQSSLLGAQRAPTQAAGRDTAALGPSDSSDSGSDLMGMDAGDIDDPNEPVDAALDGDATRALMSPDAMRGGSSDTAGTGERRSAGSDSGDPDGSDIGVDRIFTPAAGARDAMDGADSAEAGAEALDDIDAAIEEAKDERTADDGDEEVDEDADLAFMDEAAAETEGEEDDEDANPARLPAAT